MNSTHDASGLHDAPLRAGFGAFDACHRQTLRMLRKLAALINRVEERGLDTQARAMAAEVVRHFSTTARRHHEDEERYVFPSLAACTDAEIVQAMLKLQQDHDWLEEDWMDLSPQLEAMAAGRPWQDLNALREGAAAFTALSQDHIALEESCIYPQAREQLRASERRAMGREAAARRRVRGAGALPASLDGFDVLDVCHRHTLFTLGKLAALITNLTNQGPDAEARTLATEIVHFFSTTARQHHEDEERHVFPNLLASGDPEIVQAVLRLKEDHRWLAVDWTELLPQLEAVAAGQSGYDLSTLREGAQVFIALSHDHIALEESCIYPQARSRLKAGQRREMGREMAARRRAHENV